MRRSELPAQGVRGRASGVVAGPLCVRCRCCVSPVRPAGLVSYLSTGPLLPRSAACSGQR